MGWIHRRGTLPRVRRFGAVTVVLSAVAMSMTGVTAAQGDPAPVFGACPPGSVPPDSAVECAAVWVPRDYADPQGGSIELTVSRIPSGGQRLGSIVANPGGPGADALGFWSTPGEVFPAELAAHYDRIAVQPRGLRWSTPLQCTEGQSDAAKVQLGAGDRNAIKKACDAALPGYLETITTENTARDIDAVRAALGLSQISFYGTSYGTYLGAVYATLFPERVHRMVLDSNVHPDWVWTEEFAQQQAAGKRRLDDLFTWVAAHDAEYHLGDTALQVYRTWVDLATAQGGGWYANLTPPPASVADLPAGLPEPLAEIARDGVTGGAEQVGKAQNLVRALISGSTPTQGPLLSATGVASYTRTYWPLFARAMADARTDPADVRRLVAIGGASAGDPTGQMVFAAITCNENAIPDRPELLGRAMTTIASGGNALDARADLVRAGMACGDWKPEAEPVRVDGRGLAAPPLVLQSRHDALTEYAGGPAMASALGGKLITVDGGDHGTFGRNNPPLDAAVLHYLDSGEVTVDEVPQAPLP